MSKMRIAIGLVIVTLTFSLSDVTQGAVIYRQTFGTSASGYVPFTNFGWDVYRSIDNGNVSNLVGGGYNYGGLDTTGKPTDLPNVNAPATASEARGVARIWNTDNLRLSLLIYTDQYAIDRSALQLTSLSWYAAGTSASTLRAALQIDGVWYVSAATSVAPLAGNSVYNFSSSATQYTLDLLTAEWYSLTATVGSPFAISGSSSVLPSGNVTAFGVYAVPNPANDSYLLFDTYEISASAIPEPSTFVAMFLGIGVVLYKRRAGKGRSNS